MIIFICTFLLSSILGVVVEDPSFAGVGVEQTINSGKSVRSRSIIIVDCNGSGDYTKIQDAVDNASIGDSIIVWEGIYYENIIINKSISLFGNNPINTKINGVNNKEIMHISTDWVNISNFTITGSNQQYSGIGIYSVQNCSITNINISNNSCGISIKDSNFINISNNNCSFNFDYGTYLENSTKCIITRNTCVSNGIGIFIYNSKKNEIENNEVDYNHYDGIFIIDSNMNKIINNICKSNVENGIDISDSNFNFVFNNICKNNINGIFSEGSSNNEIINNYCYFNKYGIYFWGSEKSNNLINNLCNKNDISGIYIEATDYNDIILNTCNFNLIGLVIFRSDNNNINNNYFSNNSNNGILIYFYSNNNKIFNNTISYNQNIGIKIESDCKNNYVFYNNIISNTNQAIDNRTNFWNNSNQEGNYWSDYNGTDLNFDGIGDTNLPWQEVDYYPLMEPIQNFSSNIIKINIIRDLKLKLVLDQEKYQSDNNITGKFIIENKNQIDLFTVAPNLYGKNISIPPNILYEIIDQNSSQKYYSWDTQVFKIPAKSKKTIYFSLSGFNTIKAWSGVQFKLPPGNYSIQSTLRLHVDSNFYFNISSNIEYFEIINQTPGQVDNTTPTFDNLSVTITLFKQKFQFDEPITGIFNVSNKNSVDFKLDNAKFQYLWGYKFEFQSLDNSSKFCAPKSYFVLDHFQIRAGRTVTFNFSIRSNKVYQLPNNSEEDNYTNLNVGNYSTHGIFFFGESSDYISIKSNNVTFQIFENKSINDIKENISIQLFLNKLKYELYEPITGKVIISNNNSFDIILNDPLYQQLFGVYYGIFSLDYDNYSSIYDRHYEAKIDRLQKYQIKAKNNIEIKFKLEKYVKAEFHMQTRSTPEGNWSYHYSSNLPTGKYYIAAYIYDLDMPDYELEVIDHYKILSKTIKFSILEKIPEEVRNITIKLQLSNSVYLINESIIGTINISNNNPFKIELEKNILFQRFTGEHFEIKSNDTSDVYGALISNLKYPIQISAQNYTIIHFQFNQVFKYPLESKNITYTNLAPGNYSISAFFYYGNFTSFTRLDSNNVNFRVIYNKSGPCSGPGPLSPPSGDGKTGSFTTFLFYGSLSAIIIIILVTTAFIAGTEVGKYGFFSANAPLYTKKRRKKDEKYGYNRGLVQGYIDGNPGESYNAIKRALELRNGTLAYYLKVLQREGKIKGERDGMYKRFYPTTGRSTKDVIELSTIQKKIVQFIKRTPGCSQTEISNNLELIQSKVNYHVNLMVDARIIKVERDGNKTRCYIIDEAS